MFFGEKFMTIKSRGIMARNFLLDQYAIAKSAKIRRY